MIRKKAETRLGSLCLKDHKYQNTDQSLRYACDNSCVDCKAEKKQSQETKDYRERTKERDRQTHKLWYEKNRDAASEYSRNHYRLNQKREKARHRIYAKENPEIIKTIQKRARAKRKGSKIILFTETQWLMKCRDQFKWACAYCKCSLTHETVTQDHILPLCFSGEHSLRNLIPACHSCNSSKNGSNPVIWCYSRLGYLPGWLEDLIFEEWFATAYLKAFPTQYEEDE